MSNNAQGSNEQSSFTKPQTNHYSTLMTPTIYKISQNLAIKGNLEEEYFVDLTTYAKLREEYTRTLSESKMSNKSSHRIKEVERQHLHLQEMNNNLRQMLSDLIKTSKPHEEPAPITPDLLTWIGKNVPTPSQCIACASILQVANDPCGHVVFCIDCDKKAEHSFRASYNMYVSFVII